MAAFRYDISELIGAGEAVAIARDHGSTLTRHSFRRVMNNYLKGKGQYRLPCVLVGVARVPMTTEAALKAFLKHHSQDEGVQLESM